MIKKITLAFILCCMIISCGKKGDPEYKVSKKELKMQTFIINKA